MSSAIQFDKKIEINNEEYILVSQTKRGMSLAEADEAEEFWESKGCKTYYTTRMNNVPAYRAGLYVSTNDLKKLGLSLNNIFKKHVYINEMIIHYNYGFLSLSFREFKCYSFKEVNKMLCKIAYNHLPKIKKQNLTVDVHYHLNIDETLYIPYKIDNEGHNCNQAKAYARNYMIKHNYYKEYIYLFE